MGRIYWRDQGGVRRAYGDFRDYADVGGRQEALIPEGEKRATTDPDVAAMLLARRLRELEELRRRKAILEIRPDATLARYARYHLMAKARGGRVTDAWLAQHEKALRSAVTFLGDRPLDTITVRDVQAWAEALARQPSGRRDAATLSPKTVRTYLDILGHLYRRAQSEGAVPPGYNPVAAMIEKPTPAHREAAWLEVHEAALYLEAARTWKPDADARAQPFAYELVATFLLTGGRESEVLGLEVTDVSFERGTVTFRPNRWRRLKTLTSHRVVPLWPQLAEILRAYLQRTGRIGGLLFPSGRGREEKMIVECRKLLDAIGARIGWAPGEIRTRIFRHTYCATRLQTLDHGHPVSEYTVAREMGHGGFSLVRRIYGHLGTVRQRLPVVEYRVEPYADRLGDRLSLLRSS
jgi:integrase